jgi:hypothetical protein
MLSSSYEHSKIQHWHNFPLGIAGSYGSTLLRTGGLVPETVIPKDCELLGVTDTRLVSNQ